MSMKILLPLLGLVVLGAPSAALAQADWTIQVPLRVQSLPADIEAGVVVCMVSPDPGTAASSGNRAATLPGALSSTLNAFPISPGEAFPEFDGIDHNAGEYVGFQTFTPDGSGNGPSSVTVEVAAHPDADTGQKVAVQAYLCALGLRPTGTNDWLSTDPDYNNSDYWQIMTPADPGAVVAGVGGTFSGR